MKILSRKPIQVKNLKDFDGENLKTAKRSLREPLLKAFDIYKSNIYYGILTETESEHNIVLGWYQDLCDLKEEAFIEVPQMIQKYVKYN